MRIILLILVAVIALAVCVGFPLPVEFPFYLAIGWTAFVARTMSQMTVDWGVILSVVVYAVVGIVGSHLFFSWLYREWHRDAPPPVRHWRIRWTASGAALFLLMFAAGTAAIGVTHQTVWLATSPKPWYTAERGNRVRCASNLRQIGQGIVLYANDNGGRLPDDLSQLILHADIHPERLVCPSTNDEPAPGSSPAEAAPRTLRRTHCSYVYLGRGLRASSSGELLIAYEYDENHEAQGMNILFAGGHVEWFTLEAAHAMIAKQQAQPPATQP